MGTQDAQVMRDEVLGTLGDPSQVAHAELAALAQSGRQHEPGGIRKRPGSPSGPRSNLDAESRSTYCLRTRKVQTEQITALVVHVFIL